MTRVESLLRYHLSLQAERVRGGGCPNPPATLNLDKLNKQLIYG
jgi:hypothetical protein